MTGEQVRRATPPIVLQQVLIPIYLTAVKEVTALPVTENEPLDIVLKQYDISVLDIRNESYKDKKGSGGLRLIRNENPEKISIPSRPYYLY